MTAQARYFSACSIIMQQLQKELGPLSLQMTLTDVALNSPTSPTFPDRRKARVLCDYDSQDAGELSLIAGEVILFNCNLCQICVSFSSFPR